MIDIDRFICPKCRDFKFKSGYKPDGTWIRTCRGQRVMIDDDGAAVIIECAFSWPATDDWKYMHTVVCASGPDDTFKKTVAELWLYAQRQAELAGLKLMFNQTAAEYNANVTKVNWSHVNVDGLPAEFTTYRIQAPVEK